MNKPKIRAKGFENDWEIIDLGVIADVVNDTNSDNTISEVFTNSASLGIISQRDYFNHDIAKQDKIHGYLVVSPNDFVYNPRVSVTAPVGPISKNRLGRPGAMSPLYTIFRTHDINDVFLEHYFKTRYWHKYMRFNGNTGARFDRFAISLSNFFKMGIPVPHDMEQSVIAETFELFDKEILAAQDKINSLKSLKICHLNRLFPIGGKTPPMRIEGFTGEWEVKKLKDFTTRIVRKNSNLESNRALTISAQHGLIEQETFFNSRIASSNLSNYYLLRNGEFAYNKSTSQGYPYGAVKRLDKYDVGVLSTLYIAFSIDEDKVDSDYLVSYFDTHMWHEEIRLRAAEGARNHGLLNISANDFFDINILIPKTKEEQKAVGQYFKDLNETIRLHEEELERLKSLKESCLQGLFV